MQKFQAAVCRRARREVVIGLALLFVTMSAFVLFFALNYFHASGVLEQYLPVSGTERVFYNLIFVVFMYGSFTYQVSRLAFFWKVRSRVASTRQNLDDFAARGASAAPHVEIIVPSYKEEIHVIWQTLISAALLDYPSRGIVLLIDNNPDSADPADRDLLARSRQQAQFVASQLDPLATEFAAAARAFRTAGTSAETVAAGTRIAAALYEKAARFLETLADDVRNDRFGGEDDHTRTFFVDNILLEPAAAHRARASHLREGTLTHEELSAEFDRLDCMFRVRLDTFERKRYVNLSHTATKASNLNAYISVMGRSFDVVKREEGQFLVERAARHPAGADPGGEQVSFPDAPYVIILDADSFLLPNYATCMVSALQSPENERVAVMQTPYTSIPGTPHLIERAAAATTDIYYYVTEGMSFANAGSWIGAAAAIRKTALLDIVTYEEERGFSVPAFIQDITVIEDTGATIDLARKKWRVQNYPARLSYSATPSDFGALVIQRRRWSNGGLIILPSVLRYLITLSPRPRNILEGLLRVHYMIMPACISTSMLAMLIYPFDFKYVSSWIYITLPPYLYLVCRDLKFTGYRRRDILKAYTLFLILLPVVLSGVKNSLLQIFFGEKASFGRTPKVAERTAAPALIHLAILGLLAWSLHTAYHDLRSQVNQLHAVFALSNVLAIGYGIVALIGVRATIGDLFLPVRTGWARLVARLHPARIEQGVVAPPLQPAALPSAGAAMAQAALLADGQQSARQCETQPDQHAQARKITTSTIAIQSVQMANAANGRTSALGRRHGRRARRNLITTH